MGFGVHDDIRLIFPSGVVGTAEKVGSMELIIGLTYHPGRHKCFRR